MRLTSLRIKNYGCLADFELTDIPPLAIFVGANGSGKSTLLDIFAFLRDALRDDVRVALANRGGFEAVRTKGDMGPVKIELGIHQGVQQASDAVEADISYTVAIDPASEHGHIALEEMRLTATLSSGELEMSVKREPADRESSDDGSTSVRFPPELLTPDRLWLDQPFALVFLARQAGKFDALLENELAPEERDGLATLPAQAFEILDLFENVRALLRGSYVSNIDPPSAKVAADVARDHRLSERGENLANVLWHQHRGPRTESLRRAFSSVRRAIPGFERVEPVETFDGRVGLKFVETSNGDGFNAQHVSDGTVKLVAYTLLLNEPEHRLLLCIEEPENYLYPTLMWPLLEDIRTYTHDRNAQVFVTTHSPDLVNAAEPEEVFWLEKENGKTRAHRVSDDPQLVDQHNFGDQLGRMWRSGAFEGAHPDW